MLNLVHRCTATCLAPALLCASLACAAAPDPALLRARTLLLEGSPDQALEVIGAVAEFGPEAVPLLNDLAIAFVGQGRLDSALAALEAAVSAEPLFAQLDANLLALRQAIALEHYLESLALPRDSQTLPMLGAIEPFEASTAATAAAVSAPPPAVPAAPEAYDADALRDAALDRVRDWADAWRGQDVAAYLDAYSEDYSGLPEGSPRAWRRYRSERISTPAFIELELDAITARVLGPDAVLVEFIQRYRSDTFADETLKVLVLRGLDGQWAIEREFALAR